MDVRFIFFSLLINMPFGLFAQNLEFSYDASGNQEKREWICISCRPGGNSIPVLKSLTAQEKELVYQREKELVDNEKIVRGWVRVNPNPVDQILWVNWENDVDKYVKTVEIFSINGSRVFMSRYNPDEKAGNINFTDMPAAVYILLVTFSNGNKETINIIKK